MKKNDIHKLVLAGILAALVFVVTSFTRITTPFSIVKEAYFHAGDSIIFLSAMLLGPSYGALVSGIGSFFADLYLGSPQYMLVTLVIKGVMGAISGYFLYPPTNRSTPFSTILGLALACIWMSIAYYLYEVFVLGIDAIVNLPNLAINFAQGALGIILYIPLSKVVLKSRIVNF